MHEAIFIFFRFPIPRWPPSAVTKNNIKRGSVNISIAVEWTLTKFVSKWSLHWVASKLNRIDQSRWLPLLKYKNVTQRKSHWNRTNFISQWLLHEANISFLFGIPRWPPSAVTKIRTKRETDNISVMAEWILINLCQNSSRIELFSNSI